MKAKADSAPPHSEIGWHQINWKKAHQHVRRLQLRIAKATREGRQREIKIFQRLLTRSFYAKALAVKCVTENQGKRTPGVDGATWPTPESKTKAISSLKRRGYKPLPLRRVHIPKSNGKKRPLGIPTMKDRAMQALYNLALTPVAESTADRNSYGFRPGRSTADAIEQCFIALGGHKNCAQWILEGDIKACFDEINHDWLLDNVPMDKQILRAWLKAGFIYRKNLFPTNAGTPQGGVISPTLANMALDGLENLLRAKFYETTRNGRWFSHKVNFVRYADDFIVTGNSPEMLEHEVKPIIREFLAKRGLSLSEEKTKITHIEEGFDFLGQNVRKYNGKILIKPSKKNINSFLDKLRKIIAKNKTAKQENLIGILNPVIRGWANFHRHVVAKETFKTVDSLIWKRLWRWCKRRHPNKGTRWIKNKYFKCIDTRNWVFAANTADKRTLKLYDAFSTKIQRHVKVKAEANPFDPKWETYFEERYYLKIKKHPMLSKRLRTLLNRQEGKCPVCEQPFTEKDKWNVHHVIHVTAGGMDNLDNLRLLHPNCHRQVHTQKWTVR